MRRATAVLAVLMLLPAGQLNAQAPSCEDTARIHRELIARYTAERARSEVEVATEMARLKAALERALHERDAARANLKEGK